MNETIETTKVKLALSKGEERILADNMEGKDGYTVDGIAIYDEAHAILMSLGEETATYGRDSGDLPEGDARRDASCSMTDFEGDSKTDFVIDYFHLSEGCAPVMAKAFGWLPDSGEIGFIAENKEKINELLALVNGTPVSDGLYWTSVKYSKDYVWHCNMEEKVLRMYKGMSQSLAVRPVKALEGYTEV